MNKKSKKHREGVVFSTNPDFEYDYEQDDQEILTPAQHDLRVHLEKKGRGGKTACVIKPFFIELDDLKQLEKKLKAKLGVGGSCGLNEIIIQGEQRDKIIELLAQEGFKAKKAGG